MGFPSETPDETADIISLVNQSTCGHIFHVGKGESEHTVTRMCEPLYFDEPTGEYLSEDEYWKSYNAELQEVGLNHITEPWEE